MPRKQKRLTIERGIYRNGPEGTYEVRVVVGGVPYTSTLPKDSTRDELRTARTRLENTGRTETPRAVHGTLRAAMVPYLRMKAHLASVDDLEDDLRAWCARVGDVARHRLTAADVLDARAAWLTAGLSPKTINDRVGTLRNCLKLLDGKHTAALFDDITPLPVPKTPIIRIPDALIVSVDQALQRHEQDGRHSHLASRKTRARFRVLVSTGKRPCEVMRAQRSDVNLEARVWVPRDAKGGFCPGLYLNDEMLAAWQLFFDADAWGPYNHAAFARVLRHAGWPADVPLYQARHNTWIAASERGADLADISAGAGHRDIRTSRDRYVPILNSRMQRLSETLEGRFRGWPVVHSSSPARKPLTGQQNRRRA